MQHHFTFAKPFLGIACLVLFLNTGTAFGQTSTFTYKGQLPNGAGPASGSYEMQFKLFDAATNGSQIGTTLTFDGEGSNPAAVNVINRAFAVQLNFGAEAFSGADRYLEIWFRRPGELAYTPLDSRPQFTSTPYAIRALSAAAADTATNSQQLGGTAADQYVRTDDARLSDMRWPTSGSSNYVQNTTTPQAGNFNISGDGTAGGTLSGGTVNSATQYNLGGHRLLSAAGTDNLFAGINAGNSNSTGVTNSFIGAGAGNNNTSGSFNSFFGASAGQNNTTGGSNSFFGMSAGVSNTTGADNSFFGVSAGANNTTGSSNLFFGRGAGANNTSGFSNSFYGRDAGSGNATGNDNSFFGRSAGTRNTAGTNITVIGSNANVGGDGLDHATAIGAGSIVSASNTVVLGRAADTVQVPGSFVVSGSFSLSSGSTLSGSTVDAQTQYNLGGSRVLSAAGINNLFAGAGAGQANTVGNSNSFFGWSAGPVNSTGTLNSFFGANAGKSNTTANGNAFVGGNAGAANTTGGVNSFFGANAGQSNTTADNNSFVGWNAGVFNTTGGDNSFFGSGAGINNIEGTKNTLIGSNANVGANNLNYATAVGADSVVSSSNTVVLGRSADTVQVPGSLVVSGSVSLPSGSTLFGSTVNAQTQYNLGGNRVLSAAGPSNLFAGIGAGNSNTGGGNSFFGNETGAVNTSGSANSFVGAGAGAGNTSGSGNSFVGASAGLTNTTGSFNSFFGLGAGNGNAEGTNLTLIGSSANVSVTNLDHATAIGAGAIVSSSNTVVLGTSGDTVRVPGSLVVSGSFSGGLLSSNAVNSETQYKIGGRPVLSAAAVTGNLFAGIGAGISNTTGGGNSFFGAGAGQSNMTGFENSFFGVSAGQSNTTGGGNSFFGVGAGLSNTTGSSNLFFGRSAGANNTTGFSNSFFGRDAGSGNATGNDNSFFGRSAGTNNTAGTSITIVGSSANVGSDGLDHATAVGAGAMVSSSNTVVLGRSDDTVRIPGNLVMDSGTITIATLVGGGSNHLCRNAANQIADCSSSLRYKTNVTPFSSGLDLISRLRPISFDWKADGQHDVGFGAEEVAAINPLFVNYNSKGQVEGVKYDRLSVAFVNAFKEQQAQIEQQRDQLDALRKLVCLDHPNAVVCK